MAGNAERLGIYGFGAAGTSSRRSRAGRPPSAFTRPGDDAARDFALGWCWAGASDQLPDVPLDAAIIYAPSGELVPAAVRGAQGGQVVCAGIPT
jgi:propanol-preferring alcohol dehydrogenase